MTSKISLSKDLMMWRLMTTTVAVFCQIVWLKKQFRKITHQPSLKKEHLFVKRSYTLFQNGHHFSILLFPCKLALMALFKVKYSLNFTFESEAIRANLHGKKRILKWWPFWNNLYFLSIIWICKKIYTNHVWLVVRIFSNQTLKLLSVG